MTIQLVPLEAIPNQTLTIAPDSHNYEITIRTLNDTSCAATIVRDEETLVDNARCVPGYYLLRYKFMEADSGNFVWQTPNDEYPNYLNFGITHFLYFVPLADLQAARNGN